MAAQWEKILVFYAAGTISIALVFLGVILMGGTLKTQLTGVLTLVCSVIPLWLYRVIYGVEVFGERRNP